MLTVIVAFLALLVALLALWRAFSDRRCLGQRLIYLDIKLQEAEERLRLRSTLASEVAHEIKNPITAILCSVETLDLLIGKDLDPVHRDALSYIREYGDNILQLLSDFLDVSMLESGCLTAVPESTLVVDQVNSVVALLQASAIKKEITLSSHCPLDNLYVFADQKHVKQVLFNLVHNAIRYTPLQGEVKISVEACFSTDFVKIVVVDSGVGIKAEDVKTIFDVYQRIDHGNLVDGIGGGLGLSLCRDLVELNKGFIEVYSRENVGTRFEVFLPLDQKATRTEIPATESLDFYGIVQSDNLPFEGQRFLVIDEDQGARETIAGLLQALGAVVDTTAECIEAVEALEHKDYQTVLIDADVENGKAVKVAEQLKTNDRTGQLKLVLTDRKIKRDGSEQLSEHFDHRIPKPLNGKAIIRALLH